MSDREQEERSSSNAASQREPGGATAGTASAGEGTGAGPARHRAAKSGGRQEVKIQFNNPTLYGATFGIGNRAAERRGPATGTKSAADVVTKLDRYVEPGCFADARRVLEQTRLAVLEGRSGLGKRTAAFALLYKLAPGDIEQLSPTVTLEELCDHRYKAGAGYLVADYAGQERGAEAEFRWNTLSDRLRRAGAYLVVTTAARVEHIRSINWSRPDKLKLLTGLLEDLDGGAEVAARIAERVPEDWSMVDLVECAHRVREKPDQTEDALDVFDLATIGEVLAWFDGDRDRRDIVEVTALAFSAGMTERRFESVVVALDDELAKHLPVGEPADDAGPGAVSDALPARRKTRSGGASLIQVERVTTGMIPRRVLSFRSPQHRQHVLSELAARYETPFWNAVRNWLLAVVEADGCGPDELTEVAQGLAGFAAVDFGETLEMFLEPMSRGEAGPGGISCAAGVLRLMSFEDALAPAALQVAIQWINEGDVRQRVTAGEALTAELGVRYPAEAARRLWQLITQDHELADSAVVTPAFLLYNLVDSGSDATDVLELLDRQLTRFARPGPDLRLVDLTMETVLNALSVGDERTRRLAVFDLIAQHPTTVDTVAGLWARVMCNRRYRVRALEALWDGLYGSRNRARDGKVLGDALARALPPGEHAAFVRDFRAIEMRKRQRDKARTESIAQLLLEALERMHGLTPREGLT